jgi:hypothetical protein
VRNRYLHNDMEKCQKLSLNVNETISHKYLSWIFRYAPLNKHKRQSLFIQRRHIDRSWISLESRHPCIWLDVIEKLLNSSQFSPDLRAKSFRHKKWCHYVTILCTAEQMGLKFDYLSKGMTRNWRFWEIECWKSVKQTEVWSKLRMEKLNDVYFSPNIIRVTIERRIWRNILRWWAHKNFIRISKREESSLEKILKCPS